MAFFGDELQDTGVCRPLVGQVDTGVLQLEEPGTLDFHLGYSVSRYGALQSALCWGSQGISLSSTHSIVRGLMWAR